MSTLAWQQRLEIMILDPLMRYPLMDSQGWEHWSVPQHPYWAPLLKCDLSTTSTTLCQVRCWTGVQLVKEQTPKIPMGQLTISVTSQSNYVECGAGQVFSLLGRMVSLANPFSL